MTKQQINLRNQSNQQGFNLIELLVVISIIALLVSAALLLFNSSRQKSRDSRRAADAKQLIAALDLYYTHCNSFPRYGSAISVGTGNYTALYTGDGNAVTGPCGSNNGSSRFNGGFGLTSNAEQQTSGQIIIRQLRPAPSPHDSGCTSTNNNYTYTSTNDPTNATVATGFTLSFCLGGPTGGYTAGVNTITR